MDTKELTAILVVAMVGCVIVAGFVPVVGESVSDSTTFNNAGYYRMAEVENEPITMFWDHANPDKLTVNDDIIDLSTVPTNKVVTVLVTDKTIVRYAPISSDTLFQVYSDSGYLGAGVNAGTDMTITIENGTLTAFNGTTTYTKTISNGYYANNTGNWIMKYDGETAFIHDSDSIIVLAGNTKVGDVNIGIYAQGNITDGLDIETVQTDSVLRTPTYGEVTFNYTAVGGYLDLVKLSNCQFTVTLDDTTVNATYSYFLVPYEVTAEKAIHADDNTASIISMLPFILIMGIVLMFVGVVIVRRYV